MIGPVSSFEQALAFENSVQMKMKRQIQYSLSELSNDPIETSQSVKAKSSLSTTGGSVQTSNNNKVKSSGSRSTRVQSTNTQTVKTQTSSNITINTKQRARNLTSAGGSNRVVTRTKRNRKAIANTQADKRGRDSGGLTTLATSGIDGKGLSINQIR